MEARPRLRRVSLYLVRITVSEEPNPLSRGDGRRIENNRKKSTEKYRVLPLYIITRVLLTFEKWFRGVEGKV